MDDHLCHKHVDKKRPSRKWRLLLDILQVTVVLSLLAWNTRLQFVQYYIFQEIDAMKTVHDIDVIPVMSRDPKISLITKRDLEGRTYNDFGDLIAERDTVLTKESDHGFKNTIHDSVNSDNVNARVRRSSTITRERAERKKKSKRSKKSRKSKKDGPAAAHFMIKVDDDRLVRETAEGINSTQGKHTPNGFVPTGRIYTTWKAAEWNNNRVFHYNVSTGKVKVKTNGLYIVYGQVMYHSPAARKTYGIHINDELVPFVQSLAFDNIHTRSKRSLPSSPTLPKFPMDSPTLGNIAGQSVNDHDDLDLGQRRVRHSRSIPETSDNIYTSYSQCNTFAVMQLKKGDLIFLRSLEDDRAIITNKALTFWGIAKL